MSSIRTFVVVATVLLSGAAPPPAAAQAARSVIHAGRLIDGHTDTVRTQVSVTVSGDRIVSIDEGYKERGTWYVPTISAGRFVAEKATIDGYFPEIVRPKAAEIGPQIQDTFSRAWKAGVKIAFGIDQGVAPHGEKGRGFVYMVEAGMPPMKAIQSATLEGARLLDIEADLGTVETGKIAAVPGDPLADIEQMTRVHFVMKAGRIHRHDTLPRAPVTSASR